ncbi:Transmembrane protein 256 [Gryllus bimaculatus]|nr:Transmembrane protein 256 [Gryllus bimaculatus]
MGFSESFSFIYKNQVVYTLQDCTKYAFSYIMPQWKKTETVPAAHFSTKILRCSPTSLVRVAGLFGASAVILGAIGAHAHKDATPEQKKIFETANGYHFIHSVALLGVPMSRWPRTSGALLTLGMVLFCGSCYHQAFTNEKKFSAVTPWGGTLLIAGWLAMVL